jgi:hypothetical protein
MHMLIVKFHSGLDDAKVMSLLEQRLGQFREVPGLVQKYYAREDATGDYCGVYLFESEAALRAYRESALAKSIPPTYELAGAARVDILEVLFPLRP